MRGGCGSGGVARKLFPKNVKPSWRQLVSAPASVSAATGKLGRPPSSSVEQRHGTPAEPGQEGARYVLPFTSLRFGVDPDGWDMLTPQNTRVAGSFKANALDQLICMAKDCFSPVGTVVDRSGKPAGCSFRSRTLRGEQPKVPLPDATPTHNCPP